MPKERDVPKFKEEEQNPEAHLARLMELMSQWSITRQQDKLQVLLMSLRTGTKNQIRTFLTDEERTYEAVADFLVRNFTKDGVPRDPKTYWRDQANRLGQRQDESEDEFVKRVQGIAALAMENKNCQEEVQAEFAQVLMRGQSYQDELTLVFHQWKHNPGTRPMPEKGIEGAALWKQLTIWFHQRHQKSRGNLKSLKRKGGSEEFQRNKVAKTALCKYGQKCFKKDCRFRHPNKTKQGDIKGDKDLCRYFMVSGFCPRGEKCGYKHELKGASNNKTSSNYSLSILNLDNNIESELTEENQVIEKMQQARPIIKVKVFGQEHSVLFDTGSDVNAISGTFARKLAKPLVSTKILLSGASGALFSPQCINIPINIGRHAFTSKFHVIEDLPVDILVGNVSMQQQGIDILSSDSRIVVKGQGQRLTTVEANKQVLAIKHIEQKSMLLHLNSEVEMPPFCEMLVEVKNQYYSSFKQNCCVMIENVPERDSEGSPFLAAKGIGTLEEGLTKVALANLTQKPIKLPKGKVVAKCKTVRRDDYHFIPIPFLDEDTKGNDSRLLNLVLRDANELQTHPSEAQCSVCSHRVDSHTRVEYASCLLKESGLPPDLHIEVQTITIHQLEQLIVVLREFKTVFAVNPKAPGGVKFEIAEHPINTGDNPPISMGPRRVSPAQREIIKTYIQELLQNGLISESRSPWSSPVLLVPKVHAPGEYRICIDYRKLNTITKKEVYALPRIDDTIDTLSNKIYFSVMDLASGYYQIPMKPEDKAKTAFTTYSGHYEWNFMPLGLVNAPATFQRAMDACLAGLKWKCVQIYLDDAVVASASFEEHLRDVAAVLNRFHSNGFKLKASKCHFCCTEIEYLGHKVTKEGVRALPDKIKLIKDWGIPQSSANLHSFLGLAGYYRKLIKGFAQREHPLRELLKRNPTTFKMTDTEIKAFRDIQQWRTQW